MSPGRSRPTVAPAPEPMISGGAAPLRATVGQAMRRPTQPVPFEGEIRDQAFGHLMEQMRAHRGTEAWREFARDGHPAYSLAGLEHQYAAP